MSQPGIADLGIGKAQNFELFESGNDGQIIVAKRCVVQVKRLQSRQMLKADTVCRSQATVA